jgi:glyoxylase I family protein
VLRVAVRYSHVGLSCRDVGATERFYTSHFGFRRARAIPVGDSEIVFLKNGDAYLELFAAEGPRAGAVPGGDGPHGEGIRHLAFQVDDVDAQLASMGADARVTLGPLDFYDFIPGWRTAWVADPDDNIVEISQGYSDEERNR